MEGILTNRGILRSLRAFSKKNQCFVESDYSDYFLQESGAQVAILILTA